MISRMRYKDYVWPYNPEVLKIERAKNISEIKIPYQLNCLQDLGCGGRIVTGSGCFSGAGCMEEFERLVTVFSLDGGGLLYVPGMEPFSALFVSLSLKGKDGPDCVRYEFRFLEGGDAKKETSLVKSGEVFVCTGEQSLWDIAVLFGTDVDTLRENNPQIEWPNDLPAGEKVALP